MVAGSEREEEGWVWSFFPQIRYLFFVDFLKIPKRVYFGNS